MGRSHGIHAEPTTFGLTFALWYEEMKRNLVRMQTARETINYGQLSLEVERCAHGKAPVIQVPHMGGGVHDPADIQQAIEEAVR